MKIHNLLFVLFLSITNIAFSQQVSIPENKTIFVSLVNAVGPNSLTDVRVLELFAKVKQHYSEDLNINLQLKRFQHQRDHWKQTLNIINRNNIIFKWVRYFARRHQTNKKVLKLVILNPIFDFNSYWLAGMSIATCTYKRSNPVSVSNAEEFNSFGLARFNHSIVAAEHELGHSLGANHDPSLPATIMNPDPLPHLDEQGGEMHFSTFSFNQIRACIK